MRTVVIDFNFDDSEQSLGAFLKRISLPANFGGHPSACPIQEDILLDLSKCNHLGSLATATLFSLRRVFIAQGARLEILPPIQNHKLLGYCSFSGLLHEFQIGGPPTLHPDNVTIPGTIFTSLGPETQVLKLLHQFSTLDNDEEDLFHTSLTEIMTNTLDHADTQYGILTAKVHRNEGEIRVVVADTGVGIKSSLNKRFPGIGSDQDAILYALKEGVSSKSKRRNMGMGLSNISSIAVGNGGTLVLSSGYSTIRISAKGTKKQILPNAFPGTISLFKFKIAVETT